jgi:hypothetical protein
VEDGQALQTVMVRLIKQCPTFTDRFLYCFNQPSSPTGWDVAECEYRQWAEAVIDISRGQNCRAVNNKISIALSSHVALVHFDHKSLVISH